MVKLSNILPISKAASSLAALLKKSKASGEAFVITQKGYPAGVLQSVEAWAAERNRVAYLVEEANRVFDAYATDGDVSRAMHSLGEALSHFEVK